MADTEQQQVTRTVLIPEYLKDKITPSYNGQSELCEIVVSPVTKYIMGLAENEHIEKLQKEGLYHQERMKEAEEKLVAYLKDHNDKMAGYLERDKRFAGLEASLATSQAEVTRLTAEFSAQRVEARVHKDSLFAFEKALGSMAYKEILANGTTKAPIIKLEDPPEEPSQAPRGDRFDRLNDL